MGKKTKIGKQRKDKFYKLAKETGFRSRASFKLIQLNRKFEFLQKSRVLVDLCAAPGGWLQVAQQSMPVSGLIIGVDLVSIKPVHNVITLQEDITTEKCRQALKKQLKTCKVDTVLHDGAPNVGKSWLHDAFAQAQLTLSALKLATEFLVPGGWFITKVFRSKDYNSLLWVFGKLFKKVHVTKPQASRNESAEIFVVCQKYIAPDRIDSKFLDPKYIFQDVESKTPTQSILQPSKRKPKAEGYEQGDKSVFCELKASEFIFGDNHLELLSQSNKIIFDDEDIKAHRTTNSEIEEYCKDVKVLGKGELRALLDWRKKLRESIKEQEGKEKDLSIPADCDKQNIEEVEIENAINEANSLEVAKYQELKRKKKKMLREKKKVHDRMNLKMIIKDDEPIVQEERELFSINMLKSRKDLTQLEDDTNLEFGLEKEQISDDEENITETYRSTYVEYNRHEEHDPWIDEANENPEVSSGDEDEEEELEFSTYQNDESVNEMDAVSDKSDGSGDENPLLTDIVDKEEKINDVVAKWFDKDDFASIEDEEDLDLELLAEKMEEKTLSAAGRKMNAHKPIDIVNKTPNGGINFMGGTEGAKPEGQEEKFSEEDEDSDDSSEKEKPQEIKTKKKKKRVMLDPEGLALGSLMVHSKKTKRDILDSAYNRYASNDEGLPDWFVKDEEKHYRKQLPVSAEMVTEYKALLKEINARPIKKVVQAKARKKRLALKRMEKARKRAEAVTENLDMSEKEKMEQLKTIYKKATKKKDNNVTLVVAKKGMGKRARRPAGVKGRFKVVDKRMKKDDRIKKSQLKSQKKFHKPKQNIKKKR